MKKALVILFLLPFLYWVPLNLGLWLKVVPMVASEGPGKSFNVDYSFAWSIIPTYVHVSDLKLDGTDINVHWQIKIDRLVFRHSIQELFQRVLHVRQLNAEGIWVGIRQHLENEIPEVLKKLGSIPVVKESDPLPWKISISQIHLEKLKHAHLDQIVFEGDSEIQGAFMLLPGRILIISPSEWKIHEGLLSHNGLPVLEQMKGSTWVTIHPTDLIHTKGSQIFQTMDIRNSLKGQVQSADYFGVLYRPYHTKVTGKTRGPLYSELDIQQGIFQKGSTITSFLGDIHLGFNQTYVTAKGDLHWKVEASPTGDVAQLSVPLRDLKWRRESFDLAIAKKMIVRGSSKKLSLEDLFNDLQISMQANHIKVAPLNEIIATYSKKQPDLRQTAMTTAEGTADLSVLFNTSQSEFKSDIIYQTPKLQLTYNSGKTRLIGKLKTSIALIAHHNGHYRFELGKTFSDLDSIRILNQGEEEYEDDGWKINFGLENGKVAFEPELKVDGTLRLKMTDLKLPIRFFVPDKFLVKVGTFLFPMKDFKGFGQFHHDGDETWLKHFEAETSSGNIHGAFVSREKGSELAFLFSLGATQVCVAQKDGEKKPSVHAGEGHCKDSIKSYNERRD